MVEGAQEESAIIVFVTPLRSIRPVHHSHVDLRLIALVSIIYLYQLYTFSGDTLDLYMQVSHPADVCVLLFIYYIYYIYKCNELCSLQGALACCDVCIFVCLFVIPELCSSCGCCRFLSDMCLSRSRDLVFVWENKMCRIEDGAEIWIKMCIFSFWLNSLDTLIMTPHSSTLKLSSSPTQRLFNIQSRTNKAQSWWWTSVYLTFKRTCTDVEWKHDVCLTTAAQRFLTWTCWRGRQSEAEIYEASSSSSSHVKNTWSFLLLWSSAVTSVRN